MIGEYTWGATGWSSGSQYLTGSGNHETGPPGSGNHETGPQLPTHPAG